MDGNLRPMTTRGFIGTAWGHVHRTLFASLLIGMVPACDRSSSEAMTGLDLEGMTLPSLALSVTGEAAAALSPDGLFELAGPRVGNLPEISEAEARRQALAWARTFGPFNKGRMEKGHGAPIDFSSLSVCPRVYYAETPYGSLSPEAPSALHKFSGSMWMVPLCGANGSPRSSAC